MKRAWISLAALVASVVLCVFISGLIELSGSLAYGASPPDIKVVINVPEHRLFLYRNHNVLKVYPVAVGNPHTQSPRGEFTITQKAIWGDGFGTRWMRISVPWGIYGIHGTNKPWTVGTVASHGCFRMLNRDVEQLYSLVSIHTPVIIEGYVPFTRIRRPISPRAIGQDVVELQRLLRLGQVYSGPLEGVYTDHVESAVKKFQTIVGLSPTGKATLEMVKKLQEYTHQEGLKPRYLAVGSSQPRG